MQVLFINSNEQFLEKTLADSGNVNLATTSYAQAAMWARDESIPISAIYLNPNDSKFSALDFIGEITRLRPATPLYILDEAGDFSMRNFSSLSEKFKILGAFKNTLDTNELLAPLNVQVPASLLELTKRQTKKSEHANYIAVPLIDFIYAKNYPANVFVEDENKEMRFFATEGSEVDLEYLSYLSKKTAWVYIEESTIESRIASYRLVESSYLDPAYLSPSWRTSETFFRAKKFLNTLKNIGMDESLLSDTYGVLQDLFQLTHQLSQELKLNQMVEQAKRCDRSIAAVTLSVLLCKKMKYSQGSSIVKSLGFASLMQDIGLYQTPFGDLSEAKISDLSPQAAAIYLNHPIRSADALARVGSIPELALQIVRQQHERPDRTGYPYRVGGVQLQPLAEILSLINSYLDEPKKTDFYRHYSDPVVNAFQQILVAIQNNYVI